MRTVAVPTRACPTCGRSCPESDLSCDLCGTVLRRAPASYPPAFVEPAPGAVVPARGPEMAAWAEPATRTRILGIPEGWFALLLGACLAPLLTLTPILAYVGWFTASLAHESGHAALSWLLGCPAVPAIRLDGHAAAVHGEQVPWLAGAVLALLAWCTWRARSRPPAAVLWGVAALAYPALAFTDAREALFLAAGHLGEIGFATFLLSRSQSGGFTGSQPERVTHAAIGLFLLGRNVWLSGGLLWSDSVRSWYETSGSFGLANDYLRLSGEALSVPLSAIAAGSLVVAVVALPVAIVVGRR